MNRSYLSYLFIVSKLTILFDKLENKHRNSEIEITTVSAGAHTHLQPFSTEAYTFPVFNAIKKLWGSSSAYKSFPY